MIEIGLEDKDKKADWYNIDIERYVERLTGKLFNRYTDCLNSSWLIYRIERDNALKQMQ